MDVLPSATFRRTYGKLTEPTIVTVNGHTIGEWIPVKSAYYVSVQEAKAMRADVLRDVEQVAAEVAAETHTTLGLGDDVRVEFDTTPVSCYSSRPFTPVPKRRDG